jgi:hypothetical protein
VKELKKLSVFLALLLLSSPQSSSFLMYLRPSCHAMLHELDGCIPSQQYKVHGSRIITVRSSQLACLSVYRSRVNQKKFFWGGFYSNLRESRMYIGIYVIRSYSYSIGALCKREERKEVSKSNKNEK